MISSAESNSIKYLRSLALIMIVLCHLFQAFGNRWAWVLNVGVQIFFVISGFLYGSMYIENYAKWGGRRFVKLYLPYAIYIVIVMPLYSYVYGYDYFIKSIIVHLSLLQGFGKLGGVEGLNHLWFLTAIVVCYLFTPILQRTAKYNICQFLSIVCAFTIDMIFVNGKCYYVFLYSLAYYIGRHHNVVSFLTLAILLVLVLVLSLYIDWKDFEALNVLSILWKSLTSIALLVAFLCIFRKCEFCKTNHIVEVLSRYSYPVYIVHHLYILGPFSIIAAMNYSYISVILVLALILLTTFVLDIVSSVFTKKIKI